MLRCFLLFGLIFSGFIHAQTAKQYGLAGDKSFEDADYIQASVLYKLAKDIAPEQAEYAFKYAESLRLLNHYEEAAGAYEQSIAIDQTQAYPLGLFWLATMQKNQGEYLKALELFKKVKTIKNIPPMYARKAKNEVLACEYAQKHILDSLRIEIKNLGESVNSGDAEFAAQAKDSTEILLSILKAKNIGNKEEVLDKEYVVKIYRAQKTEDEWALQEALPKTINNPAYHNANASISLDQKRLYFSRCDEKNMCAIYVSYFEKNAWQNPVLLEAPINLKGSSTTQAQIVKIKGKEYLFFTSNREGGKGGFDIWYSQVSDEGKSYAAPKNAGKKVNSPDQEITPFYNTFDGCLYFSSNWHAGFGGFDVFKSCGDLKSLGVPENAGIPINSPANDLYMTFSKKDEGFISSNRSGSFTNSSKTCCNDIYEFIKLPESMDTSKEKIVERIEQINLQLPVLYFHNDEPNPKNTDTTTQWTYLETYEKYSDLLEKYQEEYTQGIDPNMQDAAKAEIEDFFSLFVDRGARDLNIFCTRLQKEVEKGEDILITVKGYASPLAKSDYNVNLTLRRISSLVNHLKKYQDGFLVPYLEHKAKNGGSITIEKIPFGEYKSDTTVSDNINDQKNSIYSKKAALERKIEILSVQFMHEKTLDVAKEPTSIIELSDTLVDFGKVKIGKEYKKVIQISNNTNQELIISDIQADCSCTQVLWDQKSFQANQTKELTLIFKPKSKGKTSKEISILDAKSKKLRKINIEALVLER